MLGFSCQNTQDKTSKRLHLSPITREKGPAFELSFCNLYSRKQYKLLFPANLDFPFLGYNTNYEKMQFSSTLIRAFCILSVHTSCVVTTPIILWFLFCYIK